MSSSDITEGLNPLYYVIESSLTLALLLSLVLWFHLLSPSEGMEVSQSDCMIQGNAQDRGNQIVSCGEH